MDYFSPRSPDVRERDGADSGNGSGYGPNGDGAAAPDYFIRVASTSPKHADPTNSTTFNAAAFGAATANPFKLNNAHPTAFPIQNGATLGFQQALLQRRSHASSHSGIPAMSNASLGSPLQTPALRQHSEGSSNSALSFGATSPGRVQKRQHHSMSHASITHKSVRTPVISSPRKLESHSPTSSDSPSSSREPSPAHTPALTIPSHAFAPSLAIPSNAKPHHAATSSTIRVPPKLSLTAETPFSQSRASSLPFSLSVSSQSLHNTPIRGSTTASSGPAGASITSTTMRRGSAVVNSRYTALTVPDGLSCLLPHPPKSMFFKSSPPPLILDLRPHTAFVAQGRIQGSINVCVPSTLIRRPNFGLAKISQTLTSKRDRSLFSNSIGLDSASARQTDRVIVIEQESSFLITDSASHSLLAKLDRHGFKGELGWVKGGFAALQKFLEDHEGQLLGKMMDWHVLSEAEEEEEEESEVEDVEDVEMDSGSHAISFNKKPPSQQFTLHADSQAGRSSISSRSSGSITSSNSDKLFPSSLASSQSSIEEEPNPRPKQNLSAFEYRHLSFTPQSKSVSTHASGAATTASGALDRASPAASKAASMPVIRPKNLPMSAFQFGSTAAYSALEGDAAAASSSASKSRPGSRQNSRATSPVMGLQSLAAAANPGARNRPEMTAVGQKGDMRTGGYSAGGGLKQAANPFFDNIRQNIEVIFKREWK